MANLFLACAILGGTILVLQFLLSLVGMGLESAGHTDGGGAIGDVADAPDSAGGDVGDFGHHDTGGSDIGGHDAGGHETGGHETGDQDPANGADGHGDGNPHSHDPVDAHQRSSASVVRLLTFQTIVAFLAFFGLGGLASQEASHPNSLALIVAIIAGSSAMVILAYAMKGFRSLQVDGTVRVQHAVGCRARVYLRIPEQGAGVGKVIVTIQNRAVEMKAKTPGRELKTGENALVRRLIDGQTVEVVPVESDVARIAT